MLKWLSGLVYLKFILTLVIGATFLAFVFVSGRICIN